MLSLQLPDMFGRTSRRRELLRIGGLSLQGLSLPHLLALQSASGGRMSGGRSCVFIFLFGGPSQLDMWDMKPQASREIRGEFRPISTSAADIQVCEHLPLLAGAMHHICLVRSMHHRMPVHGPACSEIYSGRPYPLPPITDEARREDWPSLSSLVTRFGPVGNGLPAAVVLPCLGSGESPAGDPRRGHSSPLASLSCRIFFDAQPTKEVDQHGSPHETPPKQHPGVYLSEVRLSGGL